VCCIGEQAPPKEPPVKTEGVEVLSVSRAVVMLRGVCNERLKFAIEYGNKRGTTENTYVVKVRPLLCLQGTPARLLLMFIRAQDGKDSILIDVPDEAFADDFGGCSRCSTVPALSCPALEQHVDRQCSCALLSQAALCCPQCVRWSRSWP